MDQLTSQQRKYLRGLANGLDAVVLVGKQGVTENLIQSVNTALEAHELVKVRFNEFKDEKDTLAERIREATQSHLAGRIGHVAILYRQQTDEKKRLIKLP